MDTSKVRQPAPNDKTNCKTKDKTHALLQSNDEKVGSGFFKISTHFFPVSCHRRTCDAALRALPVTQHGRIWPLFLRFSRECAVPETGARILRRYTKLEPEAGAEELFGYLVDCHRYDDAASVLSEALERPDFKGRKKTRQQLWTMLAELAVVHATAITSVDVDALIRGGIRAAKEESGEMWVLLAEYYARTGIFERSRDIYEEALETVNTVRDFAVIFDAYAKFEEGLVTAKMASFEETEVNSELHATDTLTTLRLSIPFLPSRPHQLIPTHCKHLSRPFLPPPFPAKKPPPFWHTNTPHDTQKYLAKTVGRERLERSTGDAHLKIGTSYRSTAVPVVEIGRAHV